MAPIPDLFICEARAYDLVQNDIFIADWCEPRHLRPARHELGLEQPQESNEASRMPLKQGPA